LDHHLAAAPAFLCRLEDHVRGAVEVARFLQVAGRTEQHGRVAVVAAGVHAPGMRRLVRDVGGLVHRQAVPVGPQADRAAARALPALDYADHAGLRDPAVHFDAPSRQPLGDDLRGAALLERELRVRVNVAADRAQVGVEFADVIYGFAHAGFN